MDIKEIFKDNGILKKKNMKTLLFQLVLLLMGTTFALQAQEAAIEKKWRFQNSKVISKYSITCVV